MSSTMHPCFMSPPSGKHSMNCRLKFMTGTKRGCVRTWVPKLVNKSGSVVIVKWPNFLRIVALPQILRRDLLPYLLPLVVSLHCHSQARAYSGWLYTSGAEHPALPPTSSPRLRFFFL